MSLKRPTRRQMIGYDFATGEKQHADVTDWGDVVEMFEKCDAEQLRALFEEGMTFEEFQRDYANEKEDYDYLVIAADKGYLDLVRLLVEQGADPDQWQDGTGDRAIDCAIHNKYRDLLEYLVTVVKSDEDRRRGGELLKKWRKTKKK